MPTALHGERCWPRALLSFADLRTALLQRLMKGCALHPVLHCLTDDDTYHSQRCFKPDRFLLLLNSQAAAAKLQKYIKPPSSAPSACRSSRLPRTLSVMTRALYAFLTYIDVRK